MVKRFGELITQAESRTIEGMVDGRLETEPSATDRFLARIEDTFSGGNDQQGIVFRARSLRDRGRNASEREFGADFCGVLNTRVAGFSQTKGFLVQGKSEKEGIKVRKEPYGLTTVRFTQNKELDRLKEQASRMLSVTPESFVIIYSTNGFVVAPASSVIGLEAGGELYAKAVDRFFKEYLMCFIGDPKLKAYDDTTLEGLRAETNARTAILFEVEQTRKVRA